MNPRPGIRAFDDALRRPGGSSSLHLCPAPSCVPRPLAEPALGQAQRRPGKGLRGGAEGSPARHAGSEDARRQDGPVASCSTLRASFLGLLRSGGSVSVFSRRHAGPAPDANVAPLFWELPAGASCQFSHLIVSLTYRILKNKPRLRIPCTFCALQIFLSGRSVPLCTVNAVCREMCVCDVATFIMFPLGPLSLTQEILCLRAKILAAH